MSAPEGLDLDHLTEWFTTTQPGLFGGPLTARLITGGKSNLTYLVGDGSTEVVVRRPPLGHVLATAHDMAREHRVMAALAATPVPVPQMLGLCDDTAVVGAPFYAMEFVRGDAIRHASELQARGEERTRGICEAFIDALVALHTVDPSEAGLGDFGKADGYLERQVRRWRKQLDASRHREVRGLDELSQRLSTAIPAGSGASIVHGDYRLDNTIVDDSDHIVAVLDWEMSTLGDPLSDLALLLAYQQMGAFGEAVSDATTAAGWLSVDETIARYASKSGRDTSELDFHRGLAFFKLAVILEGIHYRYTLGKTVGAGFENIGDLIGPLVDAGLEATSR